jgi:Ricin-type beta-trefoil lectin domain
MMRGIRRLVVYTAATGLLAAGLATAGMEAAHANFSDLCDGDSGDSYACTLTTSSAIPDPGSISVTVSASGTEDVAINWTVTCTDNSGNPAASTSGGVTASVTSSASATESLTPLPATADGQCNVTAALTLPTAQPAPTSGTFTASNFTGELDYTPAATASASPSPTTTSASVHPVKGYAGKCLDDKGNSSANRAVVVIWSCSSTDQAENWSYSNDEFVHNGKCLNDQGNGGNRSKVILWSCNGASNEKWSELANGELKLKAHNGAYCLDDPAYSTKNGTQLIIYNCKDSANQKWSLP